MQITEDGTIWFSHSHLPGIYVYQNGEWRNLKLSDQISDNIVHEIFIGADGIIWFETQRGLVSVDYKLFLGE